MELWLATEPQGKAYTDLLGFCEVHCTRASVVLHRGARPSQEAFDFIDRCHEFLFDRRQQSSWPGGGTLRGTETVTYFKICSGFLDMVREASTGLYDWVHPFLPEDLTFYRDDDTPMLVTIGHERAAFLNLGDAEQRQLLQSIPELRLTREAPF